MPDFIDIASQTSSIAAPFTAMGIEALSHDMQVRHQQDFQDQQLRGSKEMASYMQGLGMKTWNETNYEAQVEHMKNAGLNVGLMYSKGGQGGTTSTPSSGSVASGTARPASENVGMALQMGAQLRLLNAQAENLEADTKEKEANVPKTVADTSKTQAESDLIKQNTKLAEFNTQIAKIESELKTEGKSLSIGKLNEEYNKLTSEVKLNEATLREIDAKIIRLGVENALSQSDIKVNDATINKLSADIEQIASNIFNTTMETEAKTRLLYTEVANSIHKWEPSEEVDGKLLGDILSVLGIIGGAMSLKSGKPTQIKGFRK